MTRACLTAWMATSCLPVSVGAGQETNSPTTQTAVSPAVAAAPAATPAPAAPVKLPYGAEDVLKLSRAQVGDDITVNYVQNSGTSYNLDPQDIVYLRNQGVSERVISAMLDQRNRAAAQAAAQTAPMAAPATSTAAYADLSAAQAAPAVPSPAPVYVQPPAPEATYTPTPSTLYVIPNPNVQAAYYGHYWPYGYGYYGSPYSYYGPPGYYSPGYYGPGYYGPSVSFGFFGGGRGCYYGHHHH